MVQTCHYVPIAGQVLYDTFSHFKLTSLLLFLPVYSGGNELRENLSEIIKPFKYQNQGLNSSLLTLIPLFIHLPW